MANRHVIGKLTIEVEARQQTKAYERQQTVSGWVLAESLWRDLSLVFDQLVPDDVVVTIPQLELTVGARSEEALREALTAAFREAIGQLVKTQDPQQASFMSARQHSRQQVQHYLETGRLRWSASAAASSMADWFQQLPDAPDAEFVRFLREKAVPNPAVWLRFVYALGLENIGSFVRAQLNLSSEINAWLTELIEYQVSNRSFAERADFWRVVFQYAPLAQTNQTAFMNNLQAAAVDAARAGRVLTDVQQTQRITNSPEKTPPEQLPTEAVTGDREETLYRVANAGLVLPGQFVPPLFRWLGLIEGGDFRDEAARCRGVHLLQYMATGETDTWEYDLPLNKILCAWDMDRPVPRTGILTAHDYEGADKVLQHVLEKWPVIRSVEALRSTFLQRDGTLSRSGDGNWRLQVERKTVDILLVRPPKRSTEVVIELTDETSYPSEWGFSVVKFPWMPHLLFVDW
ncbi:contractile injection system tape measure protein [Spirosoma areae]